jgi:hypothetical protein
MLAGSFKRRHNALKGEPVSSKKRIHHGNVHECLKLAFGIDFRLTALPSTGLAYAE